MLLWFFSKHIFVEVVSPGERWCRPVVLSQCEQAGINVGATSSSFSTCTTNESCTYHHHHHHDELGAFEVCQTASESNANLLGLVMTWAQAGSPQILLYYRLTTLSRWDKGHQENAGKSKHRLDLFVKRCSGQKLWCSRFRSIKTSKVDAWSIDGRTIFTGFITYAFSNGHLFSTTFLICTFGFVLYVPQFKLRKEQALNRMRDLMYLAPRKIYHNDVERF